MVNESNKHRVSRLLIRVVSGFSTFILAVILSSTHFNRLGPNIRPGDLETQLHSIVVAKFEIPLGTRITAEQLRVAKFPTNLVELEGSFHSIDNGLLGRVAVGRIMQGEPITENHLAPIGLDDADMSAIIPEGYRGMTVRVDDLVGVSGFIMPGTLVDVVVVIEPSYSNDERDRIFKIVLQNIKVLASSQNIRSPRNEKEAEQIMAVTLQVTPEQAEKLALSSSEGKLQLVMRNSPEEGNQVQYRERSDRMPHSTKRS